MLLVRRGRSSMLTDIRRINRARTMATLVAALAARTPARHQHTTLLGAAAVVEVAVVIVMVARPWRPEVLVGIPINIHTRRRRRPVDHHRSQTIPTPRRHKANLLTVNNTADMDRAGRSTVVVVNTHTRANNNLRMAASHRRGTTPLRRIKEVTTKEDLQVSHRTADRSIMEDHLHKADTAARIES